ncbi:zf-HC2 domain-containing protein [Ferrimicrobium sp.]|uniref:zf-HC2 domain-containing protein n=1 Tax=Ferrimicrobium sp. TaxID=2926050 RepID=UPI0026026885|nr:zf-HC2 domain-containing protein [Ferrimicrobium sp.]
MKHDSSPHDLLVEYTRGTLPPSERHVFEEHLITCDDCRQAVDPIAMVVVALEMQRQQPSPKQPLLSQPAKITKLPTAWLVRTGLLLAGIAAGILIGVSVSQTPSPKPTDVIAMGSTRRGVDGSLALYRKPWGTQVKATFENLPSKGKIRMVIATHSGRVTTTWLGTNRSKIALETALPYAPNAIDWVGIYADTGDLIDSWQGN